VHTKSGRTVAFGELTKGQKLTQEVSGTIELTPPDRWQVLGTSVPKVGGRSIVTGAHKYTSDIQLPGMLHGRVLRPKTLGAKLASVSLKDAESIARVAAVRDGDFVGVAAPTLYEANTALAAIRAEWTPPSSPVSSKTLFADLKRTRGGIEQNDALETALKAADHKLKRRTPSPTSPTRRWSRGQPSPNGKMASSRSGPARSSRSVSAASWLRRSTCRRSACG
jgi:isoquinoline 1-oxidoreductase